MSVISPIHTATVYDAKKSKPFDGQRGVVTIAKKDKDGNYGPYLQQTQFTSIPTMTGDNLVDAMNDDELQVRLLPHLVDYLHTVQNAIVGDNIKSGNKTIHSEGLSIRAICGYLETETSTEKWTSERIAAWFNDSLAESIGVALLERGIDEEKLEGILGAYGKLFSDTFSSKGVIARRKAEELKKALVLAPSNDPVAAKFLARVNKVLEEQNTFENLGL